MAIQDFDKLDQQFVEGLENGFDQESQSQTVKEPRKNEKKAKPRKQETEERSIPNATAPQVDETTTPRYQDTTQPLYRDGVIETIRKAVKQFGKEAATLRITPEEKKALIRIEREYQDKGVKTSQTEVIRIAINFITNDYRENGKESILARVMKGLYE